MERTNDPADYSGELLCDRCGVDPNGQYWPICVNKRPDGSLWSHKETCEKYEYAGDLCTPCWEIMDSIEIFEEKDSVK